MTFLMKNCIPFLMLSDLLFSINAVFPIILVAAFGFIARKLNVIDDAFVKSGNKFCFRFGFFAMMFVNIYKIESLEEIRWNVVLFAVLSVLVLFLIGLFWIVFFEKDPRQKGVIHQAFYRSNYATIGIPLAFNIVGEEGLLLASLISAFSVPAFNILAVISLSAFNQTDDGKKKTNLFIHILKEIVKNPLIQGVALGLLCVVVRPFFGGWRFSTGNLRFIFKAFEALGSIAPWFSLIILGGQFKFSSVKRLFPQISVSVFARLILAPSVGMLICIFLPPVFGFPSFSSAEYASLFGLFATSEAVASISMADQMNGDSELAGQILVWTTVFSSITLFLFVAFFRHIGIF